MSCWWARWLWGPTAAPPLLGLPSAFCLMHPSQLRLCLSCWVPIPVFDNAATTSVLGRLPQRVQGAAAWPLASLAPRAPFLSLM